MSPRLHEETPQDEERGILAEAFAKAEEKKKAQAEAAEQRKKDKETKAAARAAAKEAAAQKVEPPTTVVASTEKPASTIIESTPMVEPQQGAVVDNHKEEGDTVLTPEQQTQVQSLIDAQVARIVNDLQQKGLTPAAAPAATAPAAAPTALTAQPAAQPPVAPAQPSLPQIPQQYFSTANAVEFSVKPGTIIWVAGTALVAVLVYQGTVALIQWMVAPAA